MISIIIPTYNEAENIGSLIDYLGINASFPDKLEIIVSDGISEDNTLEIAQSKGAKTITQKHTSRALQMNAGSKIANGDIYYFLHADSYPPKNFDEYIKATVNRGYEAGSFRMKWDMNHPLLNIFAWFTRFNHTWCRGGDQSIFITRNLFEKIGGYNESYRFLEDYEIVKRIKKYSKFKVIQKDILTSARKYRENGVFRLQWLVTRLYILRALGWDANKIADIYYRKLKE
jgi:rSAM/selenodomain-associated transferase 2